MSERDSPTYRPTPTESDFRLLVDQGTESRRRFQDWISAGAIAAIVLSLEIVSNPGVDRWILGAGLVILLCSVLMSAIDRMAEMELLLQGAKYAQRRVDGEVLPPHRRHVYVRKLRYYAFHVHVFLLLIGLSLVVFAAFTQSIQGG